MDPITHMRTKDMLMRDYYKSGKDLGTFALEYMSTYDDYVYELQLIEAESKGKKVTGTAFLGSQEAVDEFLKNYEISGTYTVDVIDTQKEFFMMLAEIKDDIEDHLNPNHCYANALKEVSGSVPGIL